MTARRVMLVDDHALVRMGFRMLLAACEDLEVVAEADNGEEALQRLAQGGIDLVVLDLSMPGMGGLETLRRLRARDTRVGVLVLSAHDDSAHARRSSCNWRAGAACRRSPVT